MESDLLHACEFFSSQHLSALLLSSFKPLNVFRGLTVLKVKDVNFRKGLVVYNSLFPLFYCSKYYYI